MVAEKDGDDRRGCGFMSTPEKYSDDQIWTLLRKYDHQRVSYKKIKNI